MKIEDIASAYLRCKVINVWEGCDGFQYILEGGESGFLDVENLVMHAYKLGHDDGFELGRE